MLCRILIECKTRNHKRGSIFKILTAVLYYIAYIIYFNISVISFRMNSYLTPSFGFKEKVQGMNITFC